MIKSIKISLETEINAKQKKRMFKWRTVKPCQRNTVQLFGNFSMYSCAIHTL